MAGKAKVKIQRGSINVYADLGFDAPQEHLAKAKLVGAICAAIEAEGWTQAKAAGVLGLSQPLVCRLLRGNFTGFSQDRLCGLLNRLGHDVTITVARRRKKKAGQTCVHA